MSKFGYLNLDSHEFEELCAEILSEKLDLSFRVYAEGKDKGIDIRQTNGSNEIIGQAKRYSSVSGVFGSEYDKITKIPECKTYYLFIACSLTPSKHTEIYNKFSSYMKTEENIIDATMLDSLLEDKKYEYILIKHTKLWITSQKVYDLLKAKERAIDAEVFIDNIEKHKKYYVPTADYHNALNALLKERVILIKGNAGVGKSTISEMIVLSFLNSNEDARFIYSSYGNVGSIKKQIDSTTSKQIILIDDFLGNIYINLKEDKVSDITSLIQYAKTHDNIYLILNTRVVIIEDAYTKHISFSNVMNTTKICEITINRLSKEEKARILYNHMYFSDIPDDDKKIFIEKELYKKVVDHQHYSPRLMEYICNVNYFKLSKLSYEEFVFDSLNNQLQTWEHSYNNNLDEVDRLFLQILYSIGDNNVKYSIFQKAFNKYIEPSPKYDHTIDNFNNCFVRLNNSFIETKIIVNKIKLVSFSNPSVLDLMHNHFNFSKDKDYPVFEQYLNIIGQSEFLSSNKFVNMMKDGSYKTLLFNNIREEDVWVLLFGLNKVLDIKLEQYYLSAISSAFSSGGSHLYNYYRRTLFQNMLSDDYISFYDLKKLNKDEVEELIINLSLLFSRSTIEKVVNALDLDTINDAVNNGFAFEKIVENTIDDYDKMDAVNEGVHSNEEGEYFDSEESLEQLRNGLYDKVDDIDVVSYIKEVLEDDTPDIQDIIDDNTSEDELEDLYKAYKSEYSFDYSNEANIGSSFNIDELFATLLEK